MNANDTITSESVFRDKLVGRIRHLNAEIGGPSKSFNSDPGHRLDERFKMVEELEFHHCRAMIPLLATMLNDGTPMKMQVRTRIERTISHLINKVGGGFCNTCHRELADRTNVTDNDPTHATDNDCDECGQPILEPLPFHCVNG